MFIGLHIKYPLFCSILMNLEFSGHDFEKSWNKKFHENPSSESRVVPCGRKTRGSWKFFCADGGHEEAESCSLRTEDTRKLKVVPCGRKTRGSWKLFRADGRQEEAESCSVRTEDTRKLKVALRYFAKTPKKATLKEGRNLIEKIRNVK
jgi:hypothetical protein